MTQLDFKRIIATTRYGEEYDAMVPSTFKPQKKPWYQRQWTRRKDWDTKKYLVLDPILHKKGSPSRKIIEKVLAQGRYRRGDYVRVSGSSGFVAAQITTNEWGLPFWIRFGRMDYDRQWRIELNILCLRLCWALDLSA